MGKEGFVIYTIKGLVFTGFCCVLFYFSYFLVQGLFIVYVLKCVYGIKIDILKFLAI